MIEATKKLVRQWADHCSPAALFLTELECAESALLADQAKSWRPQLNGFARWIALALGCLATGRQVVGPDGETYLLSEEGSPDVLLDLLTQLSVRAAHQLRRYEELRL